MITLTASHLLAHLFCPRFTYYGQALHIPERQENRHKVLRGRQVHQTKDARNRRYMRKRLGVVAVKRNLYLAREGLPFRGVVDEALVFADGSMAPLDWKYAEYKERVFRTYKMQSALYAYLIREIYQVPVNRGFLVFVRSDNRLVEIPFEPADFAALERVAQEAARVLTEDWFPPATRHKRKCLDCTYRRLCPK